MNKNLKKAGTGLLLSALVVGGAFAWLSTTKTATSTNNITVGQFSIKFENQKDTIALSDTFPMTQEYAKQNLTPYTYSIANKGNIPLDYYVAVDTDSMNMTFNPAEVSLLTETGLINPLVNEKTEHFANGEITDMEPRNIVAVGHLDAGQSAQHTLTAYINESTSIVDGKTASFKLKVYAVQDTDGKAPFIIKHGGGQISTSDPAPLQAIGKAFGLSDYSKVERSQKTVYNLNASNPNENFYFGDTAITEENYPTIIQKIKEAGFTTVEKEDGTMKENMIHYIATNERGDKITFEHKGSDMVAPFTASLILEVQK